MRKLVEKSMLGRAWMLAMAEPSQSLELRVKSLDNDLVHEILCSRGIIDSEDVRKFLNPSIKESMPDPFVLKDMEIGAKIIADAVREHKKIAIFGDYDVDGITSTAIMLKYLRGLGADPLWHLPTRDGEGYGLNTDAIRELKEQGAEVLISVDCGISAVAEVEYAKSLGLTVVITDHHGADSELPAADAVINPKRPDDESGLSYLAGVGVAFMFLVALNRELRQLAVSKEQRANNDNNVGKSDATFADCSLLTAISKINLLDFLDLVALGTVCDMMPLIGLNRAFVATGMKVLKLRKNLGLSVLMDSIGLKKVSEYLLSFTIGPRLNAAGRLDSAGPALELLLTDNILIARDLAAKLNKMNQERMEIQNEIMVKAIELADECIKSGRCSLWISGENWHNGVMGIIAGRLKDKYNAPSLVATIINGEIDGSGRSIPGVDLGKIIHDAIDAGILIKGGGHSAAAGFTLKAEKEQEFCEFFEDAARRQLGGAPMQSEIVIDAELDAGGASLKLIRELAALAPFGQNNPEPTLVLNGGTLAYASAMGNGNHLRGTIRTSAGNLLSFVGFNLVATKIGEFLLDDANTGAKLKLCGKLQENEYNGRVNAQFVLEDMSV